MAIGDLYNVIHQQDTSRYNNWLSGVQSWLDQNAQSGAEKQKIANWSNQGTDESTISSNVMNDMLGATHGFDLMNPSYLGKLLQHAPDIASQWELMQRATGNKQDMGGDFPTYMKNWLSGSGGVPGWGALTSDKWHDYLYGGNGVSGLLPNLQRVQGQVSGNQPLSANDQALYGGLAPGNVMDWITAATKGMNSPFTYQGLYPSLGFISNEVSSDTNTKNWTDLIKALTDAGLL